MEPPDRAPVAPAPAPKSSSATPVEPPERGNPGPMNHSVAIRDSAPPMPARMLDHARAHGLPPNGTGPDRGLGDVWGSAITRLQAQVSYNTGMLDSQRRVIQEVESRVDHALAKVGQEMQHFAGVIESLRARPPAPEPSRHDPADLEVLAENLQRVTSRVNEFGSLSMQIDLMKNRLKRVEESAAASASASASSVPPPPTSSSHRDVSMYEAAPIHPHAHSHPHSHVHAHSQPPPPPPLAAHHPLPPQHHPLPSMRTEDRRPPMHFGPPPELDPHSGQSFRPSAEPRTYSGEPPSGPPSAPPPPVKSTSHPGEPLPPPSTISGWRPAEQYPATPAAPPMAPSAVRPRTIEPDTHTSGWAAVNAHQAIKRSSDERPSPYQSPLTEGAKRPKLAPLMPSKNSQRTSFGEDGYAPTPTSFPQTATPVTSEMSYHPRGRIPSDVSLSHSQAGSVTGAGQHNFRFITSTTQADSPESWRPEPERLPPSHAPHGRGGRGRGRGGRGRGRGRGAGPGNHHHHPHRHGDPRELASPADEWEKPEFNGGQPSSNGYYHPMQGPFSPKMSSRGGLVRRGDSHMVGANDQPPDFPSTPIDRPPNDLSPAGVDMLQTSGGKKTRTKPIRNADGILIRKDGRPDMRSVSSANNLRKVHAKKEAEKADMEGQTPPPLPSAPRTGIPPSMSLDCSSSSSSSSSGDYANSSADEGDGTRSLTPNSDDADAQDRHRELMSKIYPHGVDASRPPMADQFFPRRSAGDDRRSPHPPPPPPPLVKSESVGEPRRGSGRRRDGVDSRGSQPTAPADVVMREHSSEAQQQPPPHPVARPELADQDVNMTGTTTEPPASAAAAPAPPPAAPMAVAEAANNGATA